MVTMAQSAANWRNMHTDVDHTHSLTHFTSAQLQPRGAKRQLSYYFPVHAGSSRFAVCVVGGTETAVTIANVIISGSRALFSMITGTSAATAAANGNRSGV